MCDTTITRSISIFGWVTYENLHGNLHREDGPAHISPFGNKYWYINNKRHREDGPAVIYSDGLTEWHVNNHQYTTNSSFQKAANLSDEDMTAIVLKYGNIKYDSFIYK
jgi:uncharacterized protein